VLAWSGLAAQVCAQDTQGRGSALLKQTLPASHAPVPLTTSPLTTSVIGSGDRSQVVAKVDGPPAPNELLSGPAGSPVPEPRTLLLVGTGLLLVAMATQASRRRRAASV